MSNGQIRYQIGFDVDKASLTQIKTSLQQLSLTNLRDIMKINKTDMQGATQILNQVKGQAKQVEQALQQAFNRKLNTANIETFKQSLVSAGLTTQTLYNSFSRLGASGEIAFRNLSTQLLNTNIQLRQSHTLLDKMGTTLANTVKWNIASGAINAVTRSVQQAWGYAQSLDASLNDIRIVTGKSADEMAKFAVEANKAAQELGKTTTDYTNAALIYAQQGLSDAEIQARAKITLKAANVTGQSTDAVSEQLTAVWNGYKVTADEAELYIDRLAAVAAKSASNLEELSTGMSKVASAAAAMGVGEDQLAAQLSTIISVTRQAPESVGTALRTVYARISDIKAGLDEDGVTLGNYSGKMAQLGINVLDMNGNLRDMGQVMEEIGGKWSTMTREQQVYLAQTMAGQRQYNNLLALFDNFERYNEMLGVAQNAAGTLQKQQDTYMESTAAHLNVLKASVEGVYDSLIDTKGINEIIDGLSKAAGFVETFVDGLGGGKNVLASLGSLAFMVFSKQIANSLDITINNLRAAREQANFFSQALVDAQEKAASGAGNAYTQTILADQAKFAGLAAGGSLSPESFTQLQNALNQLKNIANEIDPIQQKIKTIEANFENVSPGVTRLIQQYGSLESLLSSSDGMELLRGQLEKVQEDFKPLSDSFDQLQGKYTDFISKVGKGDFHALQQAGSAFKKQLQTLIDSDSFGKLSQEARAKIEKTFNNINLKGTRESIISQMKEAWDAVTGTIGDRIKQIDADIAQTDPNTEKYAELNQQLSDLKKRYEEAAAAEREMLDQAVAQAKIQNYTAVASSLTSLAMVVRNFQNLGSIWANDDLSIGEKLLQTITNLGMAVGMTIPAVTKLKTNLTSLFASKTADAAASKAEAQATKESANSKEADAAASKANAQATKKSTGSKMASAVASKTDAQETKNLAGAQAAQTTTSTASAQANNKQANAHLASAGAKKVQTEVTKELNAAQKANVFLAVASALFVLVGVISAVVEAQKKLREEAIEANQAVIEEERKKQEQIQTNKELYSSLEQLDKKYKDGSITRSELKSGVVDLINQYDLEESAIQSLTSSYDNLTQAIIRNMKADNARQVSSTQNAYTAANESFFLETKKDKDIVLNDEGTYSKFFESGIVFDPLEREIGYRIANSVDGIDLHQREGGLGFDLRLTMDYSPEGFQAAFDSLQTIKAQLNETYTSTQLYSSQVYNQIIEWQKELQPYLNDVNSTRLAYQDAMVNQMVDYSDLFEVDSITEYLNQYEKLIDYYKQVFNETGDTTSDPKERANAYLRQNFSALYAQFGEASTAADRFKDKFKDDVNDVDKQLGKLNQQQLGVLLQMPDSVLTDWNRFKQIIEDIVKLGPDVPHLQGVDAMQQGAEENYATAVSVQQAVSSGKTISKEALDSITSVNEKFQQFFSKTADGTYKMTGDAKTFYEMINNMKLDGFSEALAQIEYQQQQVQQPLQGFYSENHLTYDNINQSAAPNPFIPSTMMPNGADYNDFVQNATNGVNKQLVDQQLAYLQIVGKTNPALAETVKIWQEQDNAQKYSVAFAEELANKVTEVGDISEDLDGKWEQIAYQMHEAMFPTDEDVDEGTLQNLSEIIHDTADEIEGLSKDLSEGTTRAARDSEEVAESILRFDDAIVDVTEHYDEWMTALTSGSAQDQAEAMDGLRDAYQDLLDLDGSSLSESFLKDTKNLELMQQAISGSEDSYKDLMEAAQQDIAAQIGLDTTMFDIGFNHLMDLYYQGQDLDDMQIGASLNNEEFLAGLTEMINAAGMTAEQATDYLKSMGVDAEIVEQKVQGDQVTSQTGFNARWVASTSPFSAPVPTGNGGFEQATGLSYLAQSLLYEPNTTTVTTPKETSAFSLKVTSAHKSSGGGFKFKQAKHGSGSSGVSTKKSSGGGGGGGSSKSTSTKDTKKPIEDTRDIYHDINIEIQQINRNLKRVQQQQDRLYGKQLLDNLNKQSKILDQHKEKLNEKLELQKWDLAQQRQILEGLDVTFDKYGNIANYMDVLGDKQAQVNALIAEENKLIEQYNAETDSDAQKQIGDQITAQEKKVKEAEDEFKELQNKIKNYDSLREAMEDVVDDIEEATQKQIELNIQKFRMELEIRLDMGEAERDWNEFRRNVLEHSDAIKDTEFEGIFRDALQNLRDATSYFDVHGSKGSIQNLTEQLIATRNQIQAIDELGKSAIYGDNKAQAMEDLQSDLDELMNQMQDVESLIDDIDNAYLDTIDDVQDQFDKQIEDYEYIGDLIDHDISLLQLLYGDKNYDAMEKYYETLERNNLNQIDSLRQQRDFWGQQWEAAAARGDTQAAKQFEQNFRDTLQNLNQAIEDAAQTIQDKYINAIDKVFDELDKKISNGMGTDYLGMQWDLMNKNADEYLDTINSAFAIQETERKYQNAITDAKSIKNQQALKQLMDEQLGILRNKEKITQYDIDRAEKLLQVEQARIALEDAQAAKTTMRLKRDSQGNYSYEYMADEGAIGEAEADLAQAQNDLYNFDKERYQSNLDDMLAAWKDFQSEYKDIVEDVSLSEEERVAKLALLREQYGEYINDKTAENAVIRGNLMQSAFADLALLYETDVENYNNMSLEEQNILMGELVPAWVSGIQQMSDTVAGEGGFIPTCQEAFDNITEATLLYEDELNNMAQAAGANFENIKNGVDETAVAFEDLIENNEELTARLKDEMDAVSLLRAQVHALVEEYQAVYDAAKLAATAVHDFIQAQQAEAAAAAEAEQKAQKANANNSNLTTGNRNTTNSNSNNGTTLSTDKRTVTGNGSTNNGVYGGTESTQTTAPSLWEESARTQIDNNRSYTGGYTGGVNVISDEYLRKVRRLVGFATGGYTGDWVDDDGRLAVLHQKELVLNEQDTKNILDSVNIMRSVMSNLSGNISMRLGNIRTGLAQIMTDSADGIEQNVHIDANFPNVNSKKEIEDAFNDLVSLAAQRAMRK